MACLQRRAWCFLFLCLSLHAHGMRDNLRTAAFLSAASARQGGAVSHSSRTAGGDIARFLSNATGAPSGSLVDLESGSGFVLTVIVVVSTIFTVIMTIWDLWEKWNAIAVLSATLKQMKRDPEKVREHYQAYRDLENCVDQDVDEAVESMRTVAMYFRMLRYAEKQCARPDMHTNWLFGDNRCTRDAAIERVGAFYDEVCSAEYSDNLWAMVDKLGGDGANTSCTCTGNSHCGEDGWCYVDDDAPCAHKEKAAFFRVWSTSPCVQGKVDSEKAYDLQLSTCSVCAHGYFRNMELMRDRFYVDRKYGIEYEGVRLADSTARDRLKQKLAIRLKVKHNISVEALEFLPGAFPGAPVEQQVYVELMRYERLERFDQRCQDFLSTLSAGERTAATVEDLLNEKIAQLTASGAAGRAATAVSRAPGRFWNWLKGICSRTAARFSKEHPELADANSTKAIIAAGKKGMEAKLNADAHTASIETVLSDELEGEEEQHMLTSNAALVELSAEEQLEHALSLRVEEELLRRRSGRAHCKAAASSVMQVAFGSQSTSSSLAEVSDAPERGKFADVVIWMPLRWLSEAIGTGAQAIFEGMLNVFWFSLNYVYGVVGVLRNIALLSTLKTLASAAVVWINIVSFFVWLINDMVVAGWNHKMCPKISSWIELMDDVTPDADSEGSAELLARPETAKKHHFGVERCNRTAEEVNDEMAAQIRERSALVAWLQTCRGLQRSEVAPLLETFEEGDEGEVATLVAQHDRVTDLLVRELTSEDNETSPFCGTQPKSAAEKVLDLAFDDWAHFDVWGDKSAVLDISFELRVKLPEEACKCPGMQHAKCG